MQMKIGAVVGYVCICWAHVTAAASDEMSTSAAAPEDSCERSGGITKGSIGINGVSAAYLAGTGGDIDGDTLTVEHNAGFSVFSKCAKEWEPESIKQFKLLGRTMSFTVDLSRVGCACNLAFYLISSPARDRLGHPNPGSDRAGQPPYYCDANKVGGQWCPEIDIMEANNHAFQATLHSCAKPSNGHYEFCDRMGCAQNTRTHHGAYGPGQEFRIDTRLPFDVHTEFLEDAGVLTGMRTILHQAGKHVILGHSNCLGADLAKLSDAMKDGMSLRITYWGAEAQTMAWMDAPPCGPQACSGKRAGDALISNISVSQKLWQGFPAPEPAQDQWSTGKQSGGGNQWSPDESASPWKPLEGTKTYSSDWSQPWQCHAYTEEQKKVKNWCASAGFQDGFEYKYNGGHDSPCNFCWCCKRKAKVSWAPAAAKGPKAISDGDADVALEDQLVWIVSDPTDVMFGKVVPKVITEDPTLFVSLHGHGVADWEQGGRVVKLLKHSEAKLLQRKSTQKLQPKEGDESPIDCDGDGDSPCGASIKKESAYLHMFMQKYAQGSLPDLAAKWWPATSALVFLGLIVFAAVSLGVRRHLMRPLARGSGSGLAAAPAASATGPAGSGPVLASPARESSANSTSSTTALAASAQSPMRRSRSSSGVVPPLPRSGSSCQRLLELQEALA